MSTTWVSYRHGMEIAGKQMRVAGAPGQHNQISNVFDDKSCNIPAGLVGQCELETPQFAKITFRKTDGDNLHLWTHVTNLTEENRKSGVLVGYIHPSRLRGMEVGFTDLRGKRVGTAMGVRG